MIPDPDKPRKIIGLAAENFKRLKAVNINPDGTLCIVSGKNAQGKSSVLDAVWSALGGANASPPRPIRNGSKRALVELDLGDLIVTRTWYSEQSTLTVRDADSAKLGTPQRILDRLVGKLGFDPLAFTRMDARTQAETLRKLVGIDLGDLAMRRDALTEERKELNRAIKQQKGQLAGLPEPAPDTPADPVDTEALLAELRAAREDQQANEQIRAARARLGNTRQSVVDRIAEIDREIARLTEARDKANGRLAEIDAEQAELDAQMGELVDPPIADLEQRLADAQGVNQRVRDKRERDALRQSILDNEIHADDLTAQLAAIDAEKAKRLAEAASRLPVPGLGFDEDGVTLDGVPLEQASSAQQIRAGLAISAALSNGLKVALIRDGSLLDEDGLRAVHEWAEREGVQVFMERVADPKDGMGIVIEDGTVIADRQHETAAAMLF